MSSTDSLCTCRLACFECDLTGQWHAHDEACPIHPESPISEIDVPRCTYSDLPERECWHCDSSPRPHKPRTSDSAIHELRSAAAMSLRPYLRPTNPAHPQGRTLPTELRDWRLHDYVAALCDHTRNTEPHVVEEGSEDSMTTYTIRHTIVSAPLILQLQHAAASSRGMENGNRAFGSAPSASVEALAFAMEIENEVHRILKHEHGVIHSHDEYPETIAAVRHLGSLTKDQKSATAKTIRSWWAGARVITGWDLSAFKPNNTCPLCGHRGSLRIKYPTAFCTECRETWDEETIGLLAEHIRTENHEDDIEADTPVVPEVG